MHLNLPITIADHQGISRPQCIPSIAHCTKPLGVQPASPRLCSVGSPREVRDSTKVSVSGTGTGGGSGMNSTGGIVESGT